jgi:tetrathionate reductase subunit A
MAKHMSEQQNIPAEGCALTRRGFLKGSAILGGSTVLAERMQWIQDLVTRAESGALAAGEEYLLSKPENILYSVCLQCNTGCAIKAKILDGVVVKIDGSPYSPWSLAPHFPYATSPVDTAKVDAPLCLKGQAGLQTAYDPYRIVRVLKRAGKRGENKWTSIPFDQAVSEIVEGGSLFKHVPGEENRKVEGLRELYALRDPKVAQAMAVDVEAIRAKKMTVAEFKTKHAANLDKLIDPDHPDFGPKNNQMAFVWGRLKAGRGDLISRFTRDAFGSTNAHGHTTVCQGSLYFTCKAMADQFVEGKFTGGPKFYWQADAQNSEFIIFVGASPLEGNYGPTHRSKALTEGITDGRLKFAVVDPRHSKTASKAWKWVPVKPGTDGALALGLMRWIMENGHYNGTYLRNANRAAAVADKEPTWTNAAWLIKLNADGTPSAFLRGSDIGLKKEERKNAAGKAWEFDPFLVWKDGKAVPFDPNDDKNAVEGDLLARPTINGIKAQTSFMVLYDSAAKQSLAEWAGICGIEAQDIVDLAREFVSHGRKAVADVHRGAAQHTNGFYNVLAWMTLNLINGNHDYKGGLLKATTYSITSGAFDFGKMMPNKANPFGISSIRHETTYEESTIFQGYPAKRAWYPFSSDIYEEIIPSMGDMYPYQIKAMFLYMGSPGYSLPAGHTNIAVLSDPTKIPLVIVNDITVGTTSVYADYIFPDITFLERWEFQGSHPSIAPEVQPIRQPVMAPLTETVKVFGEEQPLSLESMLLGVAEKLGLPGFGPNGFGPGMDFKRDEDMYLRMTANVAAARGGVPDAGDDEVKLFMQSRRHLPKTVYDATRWEKVSDKSWKKVVYVLNRGGRFQDYDKAYAGDMAANKYGRMINMYVEKVAKGKNPITGKPFAGIATHLPILDAQGREISKLDEAKGYDLNLITYREIAHTKSRTITNYWLLQVSPENHILINAVDAQRLAIKDGDNVRVTSVTNPDGVWDLKALGKKPIVGKAKVIQGIRPGVVAFALGFGHWATGSSDFTIDGKLVKGDPRRATGVHANAAMRVDDHFKNTCMVDLVGGSVSFYDTRVKLVKA